ncbi:MAG TPA: adenylate/guanylate cyclase domain-containing protein [Saprospiraceae bacterium]|nr:adenylate/guanylate cyclase domain-containing protein [Saprospiraceae bacterium]
MFTDIVGYSAMMQGDEAIAVNVRERHREVFNQQHALHHGEIIQYFGDGTLSIFTSSVHAVECAVDIQRFLQEGNTPVPVRIGLHMGDIVHNQTEVYGDGVNVAARIENMGIAGAILLSEKINDELKNHHHITTISLGKFELKNIAHPVEVFAVTNQGLNIPTTTDLPSKAEKQAKSIAVLPFVNMSSNAENEYFSDGMTEEIINALAKIKELRVTSRTSSFFFKNKEIPVPQIGQALNVSTILEGSIRLSGHKMRITVQLIDVADDFHFWSETFDRSLDDVFAVQDEISLLIADKLRAHLGHFPIDEKLVVAPGINVESYQAYLKSRYHLLKMSKPDIELGLVLLQKVIEENPGFALAYLGVHHAYAMLGTLGLIPASEAFLKSKPYLERAIELGPDLPECQLHLAWMSFLQDWDVEGAYRHLQKVFEIRPIVDFYQTMTCVLVAEGKFESALHHISIAKEMDPFSEINYHLHGFIFYAQEKYEEAIEQFEKCVSLKPDSLVSLSYWGQALLLQGKLNEGLVFFQSLSDEKDTLLKLGGITLAYAFLEDGEEVRKGLIKLDKALKTESMDRALNLLILCKTVLGDHDGAIRLIEEGVKNRLPMMLYVNIEPLLKPLHADTKFRELMSTVIREPSSFTPSKF